MSEDLHLRSAVLAQCPCVLPDTLCARRSNRYGGTIQCTKGQKIERKETQEGDEKGKEREKEERKRKEEKEKRGERKEKRKKEREIGRRFETRVKL